MSLGSPPIHTHTHKAGTCPHGLPLGACPICNGMAGGNSTTKRDTPRNVGEMTYNQCAAIGAMLKAQKNAKAQAKLVEQNRQNALVQFQKVIFNTHQRLLQFNMIINNILHPAIAKPLTFVLNLTVGNVLRIIHNIPTSVSDFIQTVYQKLTDISDKLVAIVGELRSAIEDKISKFLSSTKKKLKSLLFVFSTDDTDNEDKKIDETKKAFELKTFIHKLYSKLKKQSEKETAKDEH